MPLPLRNFQRPSQIPLKSHLSFCLPAPSLSPRLSAAAFCFSDALIIQEIAEKSHNNLFFQAVKMLNKTLQGQDCGTPPMKKGRRILEHSPADTAALQNLQLCPSNITSLRRRPQKAPRPLHSLPYRWPGTERRLPHPPARLPSLRESY